LHWWPTGLGEVIDRLSLRHDAIVDLVVTDDELVATVQRGSGRPPLA